ncbi:MAG: hypothetical protein JST67_08100 [Bacteroidetes bacterium]|nr:hypothetical protein [Bacteroidota bacterium]
MKIFKLLFALYILCISSVPCTDVEPPCANNTVPQVCEKTCNNPHEHETCSPFCVCFCCGSMVIQAQKWEGMQPADQTSKTIHFSCINNDTKDLPSSVWQPPKMS